MHGTKLQPTIAVYPTCLKATTTAADAKPTGGGRGDRTVGSIQLSQMQEVAKLRGSYSFPGIGRWARLSAPDERDTKRKQVV